MKEISENYYLILWALIHANKPLSAPEIKERLESLDWVSLKRVSVSRALKLLSKDGDITRSEREAKKKSEPKYFYWINESGLEKFNAEKNRLNRLASLSELVSTP